MPSSHAIKNMTHSLRFAADEVLDPSELIHPNDILQAIDDRQIEHGLYGWWFDDDLPLVPRDGCMQSFGRDLLYIGIAPPKPGTRKPKGTTPVKRRLWRNHLRGSVRSSTLRLSLAAILGDRFGFEFWRDAGNRVKMTKADELRLSDWIDQHAAISMVACDSPWQLEEHLIRSGPALPLNLSMSGHPFRSRLSALRTGLARDA